MSDLNSKPTALPTIDSQVESSKAISAIETASIDYESHEGQPNMELINARQSVALLSSQLAEARNHLSAIEAKGSWLDKFHNSVSDAERTVATLVVWFERLVINQLVTDQF